MEFRQYLAGLEDGIYTNVAYAPDGTVIGVRRRTVEGTTITENSSDMDDGIETGLHYSPTKACYYVTAQAKAGHSATFGAIALYKGAYTRETAPKYQPKGYVAELMECMSYLKYVELNRPMVATTSTGFAMDIPLSVPVRITPTVTMVTAPAWIRCNGKHLTLTTVSVSSVAKKCSGLFAQFETDPVPANDGSAAFLSGIKLEINAEIV